MRGIPSLLFLAVGLVFSAAVNGALVTTRASELTQEEYDYIIVGGGTSGLTVADRLTENPNVTVLVVEYGYLDNSSYVLTPHDATNLNYGDMFDITSTPQSELLNRTESVLVGAVVGGSSAVNGMFFDRASSADYDAWAELGNPGWDWSGLLPYFKKSATFDPPSITTVEEFGYTYNLSAYGDGPVQTSLAPFQWPEEPIFWKAWDELNVSKPIEGSDGTGIGVFWVPASQDPKNQTRSYARTAHYDPVAARENYHLLTGHVVTTLNFDNLAAKSVTIRSRADNSTSQLEASQEIILAAGAIHTPQILQASGIGPTEVLEDAGIEVLLDHPGVGSNFQDHPTTYMVYNFTQDTYPNPEMLSTNASFNASAYQEYLANRSGSYTQAHGNSAAFLPLQNITEDYESIAAAVSAQNATDFLPSIYSSSKILLDGFLAQRSILARHYVSDTSAVYELPFAGSPAVAIALEKPLSRGTITLDPTNPQGQPLVDYHTLQNPIDQEMAVIQLNYTRRYFATENVQQLGPIELAPGQNYTSYSDILSILQESLLVPSFAHPSGSCAMMPLDLGGVVDSNLSVYGVKGMRIVDASIIPLIPATHLQATVYAVAEKAADIIKGY